MKNPKWAIRWFCIALALCLISSVGASLIQTGGGKVSVQTHSIPTENGKFISINLFKPDNATPDNPAPLIIASPGTYNS